MNFQVRHSSGVAKLTVAEDCTIDQLKGEISGATGIKQFRIKLKCGYPPRPLEADATSTLSSVGIRSGEMFIVEEDLEAVDPADKVVNQVSGSSQIPSADGGIMIRRIIAADNT
jgi:hypothetical protein